MSDFAKKKEESDKRIQEALEARKKRNETENNSLASKRKASDSRIEVALAERSKRVQSTLPSVMSDIENFLTVEIDHYNSTKPSYGTYDTTYENQRERRTSISKLRSKVSAYRNYMDASVADNMLSMLDQMERGYDSYLSRSKYESEDAFNKAVEKKKATEKAHSDMLNFDLHAGEREIAHLERVLKEYDTLTRYEHGEEGLKREEELRKEYGSVKDLKGLIAEKKAYLKRAKYLQDGVQMASVNDPNSENYDSGFDQYTDYAGSTWIDGGLKRFFSWDENAGFRTGYEDIRYDFINDPDTITNVLTKSTSEADLHLLSGLQVYRNMTDEQVSIYNYYYAKDGKEAADKYLDSIQESLNHQLANEIYEPMEDKVLLELAFGVAAGLDQFGSGVKNLFNTKDDYIPLSATKIASGMVRDDLADDSIPIWYNAKTGQWEDKILGNSIGQIGYDTITTTSNMLPSILVSAAVGYLNPVAGQAVGAALMGASAAGNAYQEMLNLGYDKGQARAYSNLVGASEAGLQYLLGGIGKLGGKLSGAAVNKILSGVDNAFSRIAIQFGGNMISEGIEEGLQEVLTPWFKEMTLHIDEDINWSEVAYSTLLGALTSLFMEGPGTISGYASKQAQYYKAGKAIKGVDGGVDALMNLANDVAGASSVDMQKTLNKQADKVSKNATSTRIGKLYDTVQAANNQVNASANHADIAKSLKRKGFDAKTANDIAAALVASYNGQELTMAQSKLLNSVKDSKVVQDAISNIMDNTESTMGQRSQNIRDFQGNIAKGLVTKQITERITETIRQNTTSEQFTPAGEYEVADNGKAVNNETGEEIDIKGVASVRNGALLLDIGDGKTVNATSVSFASNNDALIYEAIANLGDNISAEAANKLIAKYDGSDAAVFARGIAQAYTYGFYGIDSSELAGKHSLATELTTEQRNFAYGLGEQYRSVKDRADKAKARAMKAPGEKGVYYRDKDGNATDIRSYLEKDKRVLNEMQTTGIEFMEKMSKMMGVRFNVFESWEENGTRYYLDENGEKTEGNPNGFYDTNTGEIYIDLFAGNDYQGTMLFTVAHELTHFMRQWSPEHFTKISKLVFSHAGFKGSVSSLVADKMNGKRKLDYDTALEEIVADGMETILKDGKVAEFMSDVKKTDSKVWEKLKEWFKNFADFLKKMVDAYSGQSAQTVEGQKVADFSKKLLNQIEQIWAEGALSAGENYQAALENVVEENAEAVSSDEIITDGAVVTDGEGTKFSIKSMKHDIADGQMFEDLKTYCGWTQKQVNELRQNLENLVEYMTPNRGILDMNETYGMEGRRFSPYKPNSDPLYKISMDFSTLCSKRLLTQYVIENLQLREDRPMSAEEQMAIRDMLNEYRKVEKGLQVACAMCYVEAARLKSPQQIQRWLNDPAPLLRDYFGKKNKEFNDSVKEAQADFKESRGYARNAPKKDMKPADVKELNKIGPEMRSKYQLSAEEQAIIDKAKTLPNSTYLTAGNLSDLSETDPVIYDAYTAFVRSATRSKSLETDEPYYYGDSRRDNGNGIVVSDSFIEAVNRENGMRFSSWSDWRIQHLLDYITAVIDNSVRGAAMHGYTKFGEEVRVLGKTGMMFNMSGVSGTQTGLNEDGSLNFSPTESIDVNEAVKLRDEFPETAGLQCIGVSDAHIIALLRSDIIDYVIPYHVSGMNAALRRMANIYGWDNYTDTQHAAIDKSIKKENSADPEHWREEPVFSEFFVGYDTGMSGIEAMRASAERYKQMCKDRGMTPKFNQFANEANYWKLLIDRKMINQQTGNLIRQKAVTPTFEFNTIKEVVDRYVDNYDSGLEARALNHIVENWDSIPKRIKDLKKQGGTKAKKTKKAIGTLANQTLAAQPSAKKLSDRDTESVSNRSLLANAFDGIAKPEERELVEKYKANVENANNAQARLNALNQKIKELSFAKGKRDTEKIEELRKTAKGLSDLVSKYDKVLLKLEASKPLQDVLEREKQLVYKKVEQRGKEALAAYRLKAEVKQIEIMRDYRETKAALKQQKSDTAVMEKEFIRIANAFEKLDAKSTAKSVKDAKKIADLKAALKEETQKHREDQKAWETEFNRLLREYEAADRSIDRLEAKIEQQKQIAKNRAENQKSSSLRAKIKAFKARLESSLLSPTDRVYVPIDLIKAMVDVCDLIDTDTDLYKADGSINKAQENRNITKDRLQSLKDEYEKLKNHSDPIYAGEFDEMVYAYLTELRDKFSGKSLKEMSLDELTEMYEILRGIEETLQDARKLIGWGDAENVYEAGDAIVSEQNQITESRRKGKRNAVQKARDASLNLSLSPVRNVERMSGYHEDSFLLKLFKKFEQGIRKKNKFVMEAYKSFESLTSGKEYDDAIYQEVGGKRYEDVNGRKFGISKMQMMQTILSYEREVANGMHHIENSGFSFADLDMLRKGRLRDAISEEYSHRMPAAVNLVAEFSETLKDDKWCQDYMAAARKFFNGTAKDAINETSIALKHRIIAKDKSYIPFEVDKNFVVREISADNDIQQTINSYGMLKETKKGASQPLIITGLNNILERHIDQVGNVYGLAIEVRNFNKVWNVRSLDAVGNDPTVKAAIQRNWGNEGVKHIEQAVQDIQGPRHNEQSVLYKKVKSGYIGATFLLNLSVVTKQVGSLFSATSMLRWRDPVRQIGNLAWTMANHKKISAEVDKYTAAAWMRRQGLSDAELHTFMTEGKKSWIGRMVGKLPAVFNPGKWITAMDHAVALSLWRYAKIDTAKRTGLKGEELLKATAEFYDDVIENTQSMTDVLHRSEIQKRSDVISEAFAMFKTDLYQMAGQLYVTTGRFVANKTKANGAALGRTLYAIAASAVWAQLMTTVFALLRYKVKQYRDDEDEELTYESWLKRQGFSFAGDLVGYIFPIFGSEIVGLFENIMYGESDEIVDSIALTAINDLYDMMITVGSSVKDKEMPDPADIKKLTVKALQIFGIPASNILRTFEAIQLHAKDIANGEFFSFEAGVDRTPKHHIHRIVEAVEAGNTTVAMGLFEEAVEETAEGLTDEELDEAKATLKTALGNKYKDGEVSKATTEKILSKLFEMDEDEIYWTFDKWGYAIENGSSDDYAKYGEFYDAVQTGKNLKAVIKKYTDNGVKQDTLSSQISSHFKPMYIDMSTSEKSSIKGYLLNAWTVLGVERKDAEETIKEWEFESKYGFAYSDKAKEYKNGNISAAQLKPILISFGGMTAEEANYQIEAYDWEKQGYEDVTMAAVRDYNEHCAASRVPKTVYLHIRSFSNKTKNDVGANGKTIAFSAMKKVMAEINAQRGLTSAQKTAIARSLGWAEKNIQKYKLW